MASLQLTEEQGDVQYQNVELTASSRLETNCTSYLCLISLRNRGGLSYTRGSSKDAGTLRLLEHFFMVIIAKLVSYTDLKSEPRPRMAHKNKTTPRWAFRTI